MYRRKLENTTGGFSDLRENILTVTLHPSRQRKQHNVNKLFEIRKNATVSFSGQGLFFSLARVCGKTPGGNSSSFLYYWRGEKTALKSCSSLLALLSFPKLLTPLLQTAKAPPFPAFRNMVFVRGNATVFFSGQGLFFSLARVCGKTPGGNSSSFLYYWRGEKTALKSCSSLLALLSFPKLLTPLLQTAKAPASFRRWQLLNSASMRVQSLME